MGRLGLNIPAGSQQPFNVLFVTAQNRIREIDGIVFELNREQATLQQALRGFQGGTGPQSVVNAVSTPTKAIMTRKPMTAAAKAKLRAAAIARAQLKKQGGGPPATTTATGGKKTKPAVIGAGG